MASATYCDMPVIIDGYEAAKERQRYLIEQMEALDMTLWLARIPSDQRFHYPGKLHRDDDDNMETEILDIMREIESLQEIVDIYEDVDEDLDWEVDEEALREFELLCRGRKPSLTIPIPESALSRNPSPCSRTWAPRPVEPECEKPFNPFREEYFLGLEDAIIDEAEFMNIAGASPLSTISHNSLFGDLVDYVKEWNPFEVGSAYSSRSSSMDSTFSFNDMVSDSSMSSDAGDDCSVGKTAPGNTTKAPNMDMDTEMTVPLVLDDGRFNTSESRRSSVDSQGPWPEYLEYEIDVDEEMDYDDYYEYEEMAHQNLVHTTNYADLGSSLLNSTFESIPTTEMVDDEPALSDSSSVTDSEPCTPTTIDPRMIHISLPAYKVDYYLAFEDAEDKFIRTKFLDSAVDYEQQFPSFESVLSTFDPCFENKAFNPPMMFQHNSSMETLDLDDPMDVLEAQRAAASFARMSSL